MEERPLTLPELRGGYSEMPREEGDKPRNARSYCAQYGIPLEDVESELSEGRSHLDMVRWCNAWASDRRFRRAAIDLEVRPMAEGV